MNAKEYLQQVHMIDIRIGQRSTQLEQMKRRIREMKEMATATGSFDYSKDRVQTSATSGNVRIENAVDLEAEAESIREEIERLIRQEQELKHTIIGQIQQLTNANYVEILYRRYVEMQSFEKISCDLSYAYHYVCTLHGEALKTFEEHVLNKP